MKAAERRKRPEVRQRGVEASRRWWQRKGRFARVGITEADYWQAVSVQANKCLVCPRLGEQSRGGKLVVDHDHKTGRFRGLLCHNCNVALGLVGESTTTLKALISYIEEAGEDAS